MTCSGCDEWKRHCRYLEREISELKKDIEDERRRTSDYEKIKRERDDLKRASDRSYDRYATDPMRGTESDD